MGLFLFSGCGVKGRPLPPLEPVPIGDGRLKSQKADSENSPTKNRVPTAPPDEVKNQQNRPPGN